MDWIVTQRQRLHSLFGVFFAPEVTAAILPLTRPALRLGGPGTAVRLGGPPLLPPATPWPAWADRPLDFLAVVDFGELAGVLRLPDLPAEGRAAFYYASQTPRPWGEGLAERDGWRVLRGELAEAGPPPGVESVAPVLLGAAPFLSLPAPQEPAIERLESSYSGVLPVYEQLYAAWQQHVWPDEPVHQVGGWPVLVQRALGPDCLYASTGRDLDSIDLTDDETAAAADEWRPVLQLDSDERLGWHWGDQGRIYFCARASAPLDDAWLTLQSR